MWNFSGLLPGNFSGSSLATFGLGLGCCGPYLILGSRVWPGAEGLIEQLLPLCSGDSGRLFRNCMNEDVCIFRCEMCGKERNCPM